jgi:hypothetical protein
MVRSIQILAVVLLLAIASVIRAQSPLTPCATIDIDGPSEVEPGAELVLRVRITGPVHTTKPEFKWTVSAGTITSGQGATEIIVDTVGLGGQEVTVTAELSGAPPGCKGSVSRSTQIKLAPIACRRPFDEYGDISFEDEKARLDNFAIQISNELLSSGYILMSAGRETFENETGERLARAKSYVTDVREVDPNRVVTLDCGFTPGLRILLSIVPVGAEPPTCSYDTAIPFSEVKFTKPRPKSLQKRR